VDSLNELKILIPDLLKYKDYGSVSVIFWLSITLQLSGSNRDIAKKQATPEQLRSG